MRTARLLGIAGRRLCAFQREGLSQPHRHPSVRWDDGEVFRYAMQAMRAGSLESFLSSTTRVIRLFRLIRRFISQLLEQLENLAVGARRLVAFLLGFRLARQ